MRILLSVPTYENISPDTFKSIYGLDKAGHQVFFNFQRGYDAATARNLIAEEAINGCYDYVFMVDGDIILPSDALKHLMDPLSDIVLGIYPDRWRPNYSVFHRTNCDTIDYTLDTCYTMADINAMPKGRHETRGGGFGCGLIKTEVFEHIDYPWFYFENYKNKTKLSEDLFFCEKIHKTNYKIEIDTRVRCGHIGKTVLY